MVKQKHYDQSYKEAIKEAIVAEKLGGKSAAQIAQRERIAAHTLYKWKEKIASGNFTIRIAPRSSCVGVFASLRAP
jgi:transposase-like protein